MSWCSDWASGWTVEELWSVSGWDKKFFISSKHPDWPYVRDVYLGVKLVMA